MRCEATLPVQLGLAAASGLLVNGKDSFHVCALTCQKAQSHEIINSHLVVLSDFYYHVATIVFELTDHTNSFR
jgi:hypothetical protein